MVTKLNPDATEAAGEVAPPKRRRARTKARVRGMAPEPDSPSPEITDIWGVIEGLQKRLAGLERQNESLLRAQIELASARDRYTELYEFGPAGYLTLDHSGIIREANLAAAAMLSTDGQTLLGSRFSKFVASNFQDALQLHRQKIFASSAKEITEVELIGATKNPLVIELHSFQRANVSDGQVEWRMALVDVSVRKKAERRLAALALELEQHVAERTLEAQEKTLQLAEVINSATDAIVSVNHHQRIILFNGAAEQMFGWTAEKIVGQPLDCLIPAGLRDTRQARSNRFEDTAATSGKLGKPVTMSGRRADGSAIPIEASISKVEVAGQIIFTVILRDISDRLNLERQVLTIAEQEQKRIGHDLHDDLCQQLVAIEYQNETLINEWATAAPASVAKGREISALLRHVASHARELARGLSPAFHFEPGGLMAALQELAARTQRVFNCACRFTCATPVLMRDEAMYLHLYRIAQEAVGNALKHAKASQIDIQLKAKNGTVILSIDDNGIGLSLPSGTETGIGLRTMQYRADLIGGSLVIKRSEIGGTTIACTVRNAAHAPLQILPV